MIEKIYIGDYHINYICAIIAFEIQCGVVAIDDKGYVTKQCFDVATTSNTPVYYHPFSYDEQQKIRNKYPESMQSINKRIEGAGYRISDAKNEILELEKQLETAPDRPIIVIGGGE